MANSTRSKGVKLNESISTSKKRRNLNSKSSETGQRKIKNFVNHMAAMSTANSTGPTFSEDMKTFIAETMKQHTHEIKMDISSVRSKLDELFETVKFNSDGIVANSEKIDEVRIEMAEMKMDYEKRFLQQEIYMRKNNLLVYGVDDARDPATAVRELFNTLQIPNADTIGLVTVHRLPRTSTNPYTAKQPKPILVKFITLDDRQTVLHASYKQGDLLRKTKNTIRTDLPVLLKKFRGKLATKAYNMRTKKNLQTRIREQGTEVYLQYRKDKTSSWIDIGLEEEPEV